MSLKAAGLTVVSSTGVTVIGVETTYVLSYYPPSPGPPSSPPNMGPVSSACRHHHRTPLAQLLDVSGTVEATAWSSGAALMSSYLITGTSAAEATDGCMCVVAASPPPPAAPSPPPPTPYVQSSMFFTIATSGVNMKFNGAASVGTKLYFSPNDQDSVGVLDTVTKDFTTIAMTVGRCRLTVSKPLWFRRLKL